MTYGAHPGRCRARALDLVRRIDFQRLLIGINARGDLSRVVTANLPAEVEVGASVDVGVFGAWVGAEVASEPRYDPSGERIKGKAATPA